MILKMIVGSVGGLAAATALAGCLVGPNSSAPVSSPTANSQSSAAPSRSAAASEPAASEPAAPSAVPAPAASVDATGYTKEVAANVLSDYLAALVSKDPTTICALDSRTAPMNSNRLTQTECVSLHAGRITGKDWTNLERDCWGSGKDLAACAGMRPVPAKAEPNKLGYFVFDSTRDGFSYSNGTPQGCDPENSTGCWFVVVRDPDGRLSVAPHWGELIYR